MQTDVNLPFITADATGAKHLQMTLTRWVGHAPCAAALAGGSCAGCEQHSAGC